ncbi:hypothetical protein M0R19_05210 [Candidatus Pacearchaeota archaeon]|jgi:hypothetical protein|nr:hypothetical protein [Candidatus Pacearchaeota archaeon]
MIKNLGWFGTIAGMLGALVLALNLQFSGWGFVLFWVSSTTWACIAFVRKDWSLFTINFVFTVTNALGIIRYLL